MRTRLKSLERRLTRLALLVQDWSVASERARKLRKARAMMTSLIRLGLERAGLDPADAVSLRRDETSEPPAPPPRVYRTDPREAFFAHMRLLAERMRGEPPSLATASPVALLAYYCFGDGVTEAPA